MTKSVEAKEANRKRPRSKRGEASNPPSTQIETGGGKTSNPPPQTDIGGGEAENLERGGEAEELQFILKDRDLLECAVCTEPLCPPIYQCTNGHLECSLCWSKRIERKEMNCHICLSPVVSRCNAVEKIVESMHLPCTYASFGCSQIVPYSQRELHTNACAFGPSSCPIPGCDRKAFLGALLCLVDTVCCPNISTTNPTPCQQNIDQKCNNAWIDVVGWLWYLVGEWLGHFIQDHSFHQTNFVYGKSWTIMFEQGDSYFILSGPERDVLLLVNEPVLNMGNAISLYYIDPPHPCPNVLSSELMVGTDTDTKTSLVYLKSLVGSMKEKDKCCSLLLAPGFSTSGQMEVHIVIKKRK